MLIVENVSKSFDGHHVLLGVSFSVPAGAVIGISGPSGGGKSTLLRCIQGLDTIDSGRIDCQWEEIGFIFQDFQLFNHMTVMENVIYAAKVRGKSYKDYAMELLTKLGIIHRADFYPNKLSGGEKQRVALARSLVLQPNLLLCDEPTSSLDIGTIADVILLMNEVRQMGVTMLIVSHDLDFLTKLTDRTFVLRGGVMELGPSSKNL